MTKNEEYLSKLADTLGVYFFYADLLKKYPQFPFWSGSHDPKFHHFGEGGLIQHTREVVELGLHSIAMLDNCKYVDQSEYFLAALFHDTGKMYDYEEGTWASTPHKRLIHHIPRSALIWHDICGKNEIYEVYHDRVLHAILAHHGTREAGSPVAPKSRVAWLLHLSDAMSARMNDCDTLDVVNRPKYP